MTAAEAAFDAAVDELCRLPTGTPGRGRRAAALLRGLVGGDPSTAPHAMYRLSALLPIAEADPPDDPDWPRLRATVKAQGMLYAAMHGTLPDVGLAFAELDALEAEFAGDPALAVQFRSARAGLTLVRSVARGDEPAIRRLSDEVASLAAMLPSDNARAQQLVEPLRRAAAAMAVSQDGDPRTLWPAFEDLLAASEGLPAGDPLRRAVSDAAARLQPFRTGGEPVGDPVHALTNLLNRSGAADGDQVLNHLAAGGAKLRAGEETDLGRVSEGIEHFRKALALAKPGHAQRSFCLTSVALALYRRSELTGTVDGLTEAVEHLEQARQLLGGPDHSQWNFVNGLIGEVRHRLGQHSAAHEDGLAAQRRHVWRALLQSDPAEAQREIREAAAEATYLARRSVLDNNATGAITALDTGRGLLLFAATEVQRIGAGLEPAEHSGLVARWRAAASPEAEADARREVLNAVSAGAAARLFEPPSLSEIQSALFTVDADALVYLVPADPPMTGAAVIAPVDGPASVLYLPNLLLKDPDVGRYLTALGSRDALRYRDLTAQTGEVAASLDRLCDWAWRAAIGPLLQQYVASRPRPVSGRVPRLILVPMGDLARIPWAAARRADGRYAIQLAAFSQIASARMLHDNASRPPVTVTPVGLVVGDPDTAGRLTDLAAARYEAYTIRQVFYPGARYLGRRPDGSTSPSGAGTAEQVRRWLVSPEPSAGTMLHLACHGLFRVDQHDAQACLVLSGSPGELGADELVALMTGASGRDIALAVLATCNSGRSIYGYDEAYSLGTAFLAGGVRSVLSTQWSVPDRETSSLMFMFHHFLRRNGCAVWDALRRAQLWMLDPHRVVPSHLPAELRPRPTSADVVAWAGFVHWGQ